MVLHSVLQVYRRSVDRRRPKLDRHSGVIDQLLGDGIRKRSILLAAIQSHYVFEVRYGRPNKGNDKGKV